MARARTRVCDVTHRAPDVRRRWQVVRVSLTWAALHRGGGRRGKAHLGEVRRRKAGLPARIRRLRLPVRRRERSGRARQTPARRLPRYDPAANSRQACGEICSAARHAARRSSFKHPDRRRADHVARPGHGKGRDRQAAGERLQQHETERVGLAREHEDVGARIGLRQRLALPRAEEDGVADICAPARRAPARRRRSAWCRADRDRETPRDSSPPRRGRRTGTPGAAGRGRRRADETARRRRRAATAPRCESRARAIRWRAPASPPSPPGSAPWNRRSAAQIQLSGTGRRAEMYSGKRVWKLVVNGRPCWRQ